jgi:hypothetical protein
MFKRTFSAAAIALAAIAQPALAQEIYIGASKHTVDTRPFR